ncbi:MAG: hypothetical protein R3B72_50645 [Polyangiaceae bacterium]
MSTILEELVDIGHNPTPGNLTESELRRKPDIFNANRLHLYEIKPKGSEKLAASEATYYIGLFRRAGIRVARGPRGEPGTSGVLPAPAGYYYFNTPRTAVIVYEYRRAPPPPLQQKVEEKQPEKKELTFMERLMITTGITSTAGIIIYLVISEGSRVVFPPRNLLPVP